MAPLQAANSVPVDEEDEEVGYVHIRVGIHSGPAVTNVIGAHRPRLCFFGDTINTASRMESNSKRDCIHLSEAAVGLIRSQSEPAHFKLVDRGIIQVKGKGEMRTYWLLLETRPPPD